MQKLAAIISVSSALLIGAQAFAGARSNAQVRNVTSEPSYYCGVLKAYGQVDVKECGPSQLRDVRTKR